jgi:hypothetical protein
MIISPFSYPYFCYGLVPLPGVPSVTLLWLADHTASSAQDIDSVINRSAPLIVRRKTNLQVESEMEFLAPHFDDAIGWFVANTPYKHMIRRTEDTAVLSVERNELN